MEDGGWAWDDAQVPLDMVTSRGGFVVSCLPGQPSCLPLTGQQSE